MSAKLIGCLTCFMYILNLCQVRYSRVKFHHCRICVTDFRDGGWGGWGGIFAPRSVSRPKKTQYEYDEQKKYLSGNFSLLNFADIPRKQLKNEIILEEKKSDLSYLSCRCVQSYVHGAMQHIANHTEHLVSSRSSICRT